MSELFEAIRRGDAEAVARMLDGEPSLAGTRENGVTPLLGALYNGKREVAEVIAARIRLTVHEAAAWGDAAAVEAELAREPDLIDTPSEDGFHPLSLAAFFGQPEVARLLISRGASVSLPAENAMRVAPLHAAAAVGNRELVELLLERGADPDARQQNDYTAMHTAAQHGDIEIAEMLRRHGANLTARTTDGLTPADVAQKAGREEFLAWLRAATR